jgi:transposase
MDTTQEPSVVVTVRDSHVEARVSPGVPWVSRPLRLRRANREDVIRVPARLKDWLPPDHLARQIWTTVEGLDLTEFYVDIQVEDGTPGAPATDPLLLVAVWVYATSQGETCARAVADLCVNHVAYIWLCGGVSMNYHTLSDFLTRYGAALDQLMTQVVQRMREAGLIEFDAHAQDGMRVRASAGAASFHREATLSKSLEKAQAQVQVLEQTRAAETSDWSAREQAAQERAAQERVERLTAALAELPAVRAVKPADERGDARVSSTDPEARVMKMADGGFRPAYNWEFVVDTARLVIMGVEVVNAGSDKAQTLPMLKQDQRRGGRLPHDWLMDGGFVTLSAIEVAEVDQRVRVIAPVPEPKDETRDRYAPLPSDSSAVAAWRQRMGTDEAKETYKLRAATVECVNAQARTSHGVYQVRVRGRAKVRCVALWVAITHNLLIWIRDAHAQTPPASLEQPVNLA